MFGGWRGYLKAATNPRSPHVHERQTLPKDRFPALLGRRSPSLDRRGGNAIFRSSIAACPLTRDATSFANVATSPVDGGSRRCNMIG